MSDLQPHSSNIDSFIRRVQRRLNRFRLWDTLVWCLALSLGLLVIAGLVQILRGYAVPGGWYAISGLLLILSTLIAWPLRRWSQPAAARFADEYFGLKDSITSRLHLRAQDSTNDMAELQAQATEDAVRPLDSRTIPFRWPVKRLVASALLFLAAGAMAFKSPSPLVIAEQQQAAEMNAKTEEINTFLEEEVQKLAKEAVDEEEKEDLELEQIKAAVQKLRQTKDQKEALRQYAELERKLRDAAQRLNQRKAEQLLAKVGEDLKQEQDAEARELGRKLAQKDFKAAAEKLAQMQPPQTDMNKLDEQRKQLARLRAAAQRMAATASAASRSGSKASGKGKSGDAASSSAAGQSAGQGQGEGSGKSSNNDGDAETISEMLSQLDKHARELDEALKNASMEKKRLGQCKSASTNKCNSSCKSLSASISSLKQCLSRMDKKCQSKKKLSNLCEKASQCQNYLRKKDCQSLGQCLNPTSGGKKAGSGTNESRRDPLLDALASGEQHMLKGTKGSGPSQTSIEAADDGSGVTSSRGPAQRVEFEKQMESFVQREDVPEDIKDGVKEYFQQIHRTEN